MSVLQYITEGALQAVVIIGMGGENAWPKFGAFLSISPIWLKICEKLPEPLYFHEFMVPSCQNNQNPLYDFDFVDWEIFWQLTLLLICCYKKPFKQRYQFFGEKLPRPKFFKEYDGATRFAIGALFRRVKNGLIWYVQKIKIF